MAENEWLKNAKNNLLPLSVSDEFTEAKMEWMYIGLIDNEEANFKCQLCGHNDIRYEYKIRNKFIETNELIVGSSCIKKFIDYLSNSHNYLFDIDDEIVNKDKVEQEKKQYWKIILFDALDKNFKGTNFKNSLRGQIENGKKLTINQAKYLMDFYDELNEKEKTALRKLLIIKLGKNTQKDQYNNLSDEQKQFINMMLNPQQRKIIERLN